MENENTSPDITPEKTSQNTDNSGLEAFVRSWDFMKLGQALDKQNWNSAMMITMRMKKTAEELGLSDFSRKISQIRTLVQNRNKTQALNSMAQLTAMRVAQLRRLNAQNTADPDRNP